MDQDPAGAALAIRAPRKRTAHPVGATDHSGGAHPASKAQAGNESGSPLTRERALDTSAQLDKVAEKEARERLQKRARAKYLTVPLVEALIKVGGPMEKSYRRSLDCYGILKQRDGQLTGRRCKCRWCLACNRIRTAISWERYGDLLVTKGAPHERDFLVTLTVPNVHHGSLRGRVQAMHSTFARIVRRMKAAKGRPALDALRKSEVTYNADRRDFHPHLHVIVRGRHPSDMLVSEWLVEWGEARRSAQDVRPLDRGGAAELFKYFTKLPTPGQHGRSNSFAPEALNTIFSALKGLRTLQPYGLFFANQRLRGKTDEELMDEGYTGSPESDAPHRTAWVWEQSIGDWCDRRTGLILGWHEPQGMSRRKASRANSHPTRAQAH